MDGEVPTTKILGILALQGDYDAHRKVLDERLHVESALVRTPAELAKVDGLILPGGESTTIGKLLARIDLFEPIRQRIANGMPAYGTCAGMILLAREIAGRPDQPTLSVMDITVERNAFGRQLDSFEADVPFTDGQGAEHEVRGVFIRAPEVTRTGPGVEIVGTFQDKVVAVRQGNILATAFHPELTDDPSVHAAFVRMCATAQERR